MKTPNPQFTDGELMDKYLSEREYDRCANEQEAIKKARARHRAHERAHGPTGQLRTLVETKLGESALLAGYTSTRQVSALVGSVSLAEGAKFSSRIERSLVDDSIVGVRVTLVAFTR